MNEEKNDAPEAKTFAGQPIESESNEKKELTWALKDWSYEAEKEAADKILNKPDAGTLPGPLRSIGERLDHIEAQLDELPRILATMEVQVNNALKTIQNALGISIEATKEGSFQTRIQSKVNGRPPGVLAAVYWDVAELKNKADEKKIVLATAMPKIGGR